MKIEPDNEKIIMLQDLMVKSGVFILNPVTESFAVYTYVSLPPSNIIRRYQIILRDE